MTYGSCNSQTVTISLKVGNVYCHNADHSLKIKITKQWNVNLFQGEVVDGPAAGNQYLFASTGTAIGFDGHHGSTLGWSILEEPPKPVYEVGLIHSWHRAHTLNQDDNWVPLYFYDGGSPDGLYFVREKGADFNTVKVYSGPEFKKFRAANLEDND